MYFKVKQSEIIFKIVNKIWILRFVNRIKNRRKNATLFIVLLSILIYIINVLAALVFILIILILIIYDYFDHKKAFENYIINLISYYYSNSVDFIIKVDNDLEFIRPNFEKNTISINQIKEVIEGEFKNFKFISFLDRSIHSYVTVCSDQFENDIDYERFVSLLKVKINNLI